MLPVRLIANLILSDAYDPAHHGRWIPNGRDPLIGLQEDRLQDVARLEVLSHRAAHPQPDERQQLSRAPLVERRHGSVRALAHVLEESRRVGRRHEGNLTIAVRRDVRFRLQRRPCS